MDVLSTSKTPGNISTTSLPPFADLHIHLHEKN